MEKYSSITDLTQKNQLLNFALNAAGVGTWTLDPINQVIHWDTRCRELYGFPKDAIVSYGQVLDYVFPEDRSLVQAAVGEALTYESGGKYELQFRTLGPSGLLRSIYCRGQAFFNDANVAYLFAGTAQDVTELVNLRQKEFMQLRNSQHALEGAKAGSFKINMVTGETEYSPLLKRLFTGTAEGPSTREDLVNSIHPDDQHIRTNAYETAKRTGILEYEVRAIWQDGSVHWTKTTGTFERDEKGNPLLLSGISVESTEAKTAQLALEESETRFSALIEQAPIATCLFTGKEMTVAIANDLMIGIWGKGRSVMNKPLLEALPELVGQPFIGILNEIYSTGVPFEAKAARADLVVNGVLDTYYFDYTYKPIFDSNNNIYGIMDMAVDVTAQVKAKMNVEEAEAALRTAVSVADLGTWEADLTSATIKYSDVVKKWLGTEENECSIDFFYKRVDEEDRTKVIDIFRNAEDHAATKNFDVEFVIANVKSGVKTILHSQARAVRNTSTMTTSLIGIMQDVTEQRNTKLALEQQVQERTEELAASNEELAASNEELQSTIEELGEANNNLNRSNQELEQYAYAASHDLQEPLRKIQTFSNLLTRTNNTPENQSNYIEKINASAERMTMLIQDLLNFSRLQVFEKAFVSVDLFTIVHNLINDFEVAIENENATIKIGKLPVIEGIPAQLNQLFYNLISNALKFKNEKAAPKITIQSRPVSTAELSQLRIKPMRNVQYFDISVTDNGIGFHERYANQIFEIFRRLHTRTEYPGSGIGLAISKRIADNHNGIITVDSKVGEGSSFHIFLPQKQKSGAGS